MEPSQRQCRVCIHYQESKLFVSRGRCENLDTEVREFWNGCVMNKTKEEANMESEVINFDTSVESQKQGITLDQSQERAVQLIKEWFEKTEKEQKKARSEAKEFDEYLDKIGPCPRFVLAGLAGTGKSTIISYAIEQLNLYSNEVTYCAYTGKAALVLKGKGLRASTIHKLIYDPVENKLTGEVEFFLKEELDESLRLIVVDEASMVSKKIQEDLESFNIPIIYVGDHGQLPPVGDSFADLMSKPNVRIEEIHRQAKDNPIIKAALFARRGQSSMLISMGKEFRRLTGRSLNLSHLLETEQVLVGRNTTRQSINRQIRDKLGFTSPFPEPGDRVMCLQNKRNGLVNGMQGVVHAVEPATDGEENHFHMVFEDEEGNFYGSVEGKKIYGQHKPVIMEINGEIYPALVVQKQPFLGGKVDFKDKAIAFDFAYAITTHKAQGSQYSSVVIIEEFLGDRDYHKRWLYTAITRGVDSVMMFT